MRDLVEKLICADKYIFLKGNLSGCPNAKFIEPLLNVDSLYDFDSEPIFSPFASVQTYVIISKYNNFNAPIDNPFFNIQIIFLLDNGNNLSQLGTGILENNILKFNSTETSTTIGTITYDKCADSFKIIRFSTPPENIYIDEGNFNIISQHQFVSETGIRIL